MNIWIIIPAYNEKNRVQKVIEEIKSVVTMTNIVVVDDGSKTPVKIANDKRTTILRHDVNLGKGAAMKTGADFAFTQGADAVLFMDADGQHDAQEIPNFIKHLEKKIDVVFGSRRPALKTPLIRLLGTKLASVYVNILFGIYISDILSGFRALTKKAYEKLMWDSRRYGVETEMVARLGKYKEELKFIEFPIDPIYIDKYKGVTIINALELLPQTIWWKLFWVFK